MSGFLPTPTPLMTPEAARDLARSLKALSEQFAGAGAVAEARNALTQSQWWLAYAQTLAQTKAQGA